MCCLLGWHSGSGKPCNNDSDKEVVPKESQQKSSSASSFRSPVMDEERTRSGHWLGLVLWVTFSVLTLLVGWHEGHVACKKLFFFPKQVVEENWGETGYPKFTCLVWAPGSTAPLIHLLIAVLCTSFTCLHHTLPHLSFSSSLFLTYLFLLE